MSRQDLDNAVGGFEARHGRGRCRRAPTSSRLQQLQGFSRIYAPFDGVITARNTDIGALIDSGNGAKELFHVAATDRLRVFVSVPQVYSQAARTGLEAKRDAARSFPGRTFTGKLARTAEAIDVASRTLLDRSGRRQPEGRAAAGRVRARCELQLPTGRVVVPAAGEHADLPRRRACRSRPSRAAAWCMQAVTLGRDFGTTVEVLTGPHRRRAGRDQPAGCADRRPGGARGRAGRQRGAAVRRLRLQLVALCCRVARAAPAVRRMSRPRRPRRRPAFKENADWKTAQPADVQLRGTLVGGLRRFAAERPRGAGGGLERDAEAGAGAVPPGARGDRHQSRGPRTRRSASTRRSPRASRPNTRGPGVQERAASKTSCCRSTCPYEADVWGRVRDSVGVEPRRGAGVRRRMSRASGSSLHAELATELLRAARPRCREGASWIPPSPRSSARWS